MSRGMTVAASDDMDTAARFSMRTAGAPSPEGGPG